MANQIWQVDSRLAISSRKSGGYTILKIELKADNDDALRSPKIIVTLPRKSKVHGVKLPSKFKNTPYQVMGYNNLALNHEPNPVDSYVQFDIRSLNKETFKVEVSIVPVNGSFDVPSSAAAFVYGITPELNKENNYSIVYVN